MTQEATQNLPPVAGGIFSDAAIARVEWLTLILGGLGVAYAGWRWGWRGAVGLAIGAVFSWINFRWLKGTIRAFGQSAMVSPTITAQGEVVPPRVPLGAYFKFFGRFVLLLAGVYVILTRTSLPVITVFAGLFASSAAVVAGLVYELLLSLVRQGIRGS